MTHIQQRRDQEAVWALDNPVLYEGEAGHETDTGRWKLGDGVTAWNALPYKSDVDSVAGKTGVVLLDVDDVSGAAPLASPAFTGGPTAPTPSTGNDSERLATTAFVKAVVAALVDGSPALLDTLNELAAALGDDPDFATTMANALATKAPLASPALTGNPTAPTPTAGDNDTSLATTAFVRDAIMGHTGSGSRPDDWAEGQPSQPLTLQMITGGVGGNTNALGELGVVFPGAGFPNGVLYVAATTLTGTAVAPVVDTGSVSKTAVGFLWDGVADTTISFTYLAIGY